MFSIALRGDVGRLVPGDPQPACRRRASWCPSVGRPVGPCAGSPASTHALKPCADHRRLHPPVAVDAPAEDQALLADARVPAVRGLVAHEVRRLAVAVGRADAHDDAVLQVRAQQAVVGVVRRAGEDERSSSSGTGRGRPAPSRDPEPSPSGFATRTAVGVAVLVAAVRWRGAKRAPPTAAPIPIARDRRRSSWREREASAIAASSVASRGGEASSGKRPCPGPGRTSVHLGELARPPASTGTRRRAAGPGRARRGRRAPIRADRREGSSRARRSRRASPRPRQGAPRGRVRRTGLWPVPRETLASEVPLGRCEALGLRLTRLVGVRVGAWEVLLDEVPHRPIASARGEVDPLGVPVGEPPDVIRRETNLHRGVACTQLGRPLVRPDEQRPCCPARDRERRSSGSPTTRAASSEGVMRSRRLSSVQRIFMRQSLSGMRVILVPGRAPNVRGCTDWRRGQIRIDATGPAVTATSRPRR